MGVCCRFCGRPCGAEFAITMTRQYYLANRTDILATERRRYAKNRVAILNRIKTRAARDPEYRASIRAGKRKAKYGVTPEQVQEILTKQNGVCAICGRPESRQQNGHIQAMAVDHDHATGRVRGLLCGACNSAIGLLQDDTALFQNAIVYILSHRH